MKLLSHCRENHHVPALIHVEEVTQPQGHSTSGSHERYTKLLSNCKWAEEFDCIAQMKKWMLSSDNAAEGSDRYRRRIRYHPQGR